MKLQVSLEYILVTSFFISIVLSAFVFLYHQYYSSQSEYYSAVIEKNIKEISDLAEIIYIQGQPAKITLELNFPKLTKIKCENDTIYYEYENVKNFIKGNYIAVCNLNLVAIQKIIIESKENYVEIKI